jgi:hypothetical protein
MVLKAGNLVKFTYDEVYAIVNKKVDNILYLDGHDYPFEVEWFTEDDYCRRHNNKEALVSKEQGKKFDAGKAPISLIPTEYILGTAAVFNFGGQKYGLHNFRSGLAHSRCLDAAMRHICAILAGEEIDAESGLPHVYHASCSLAMYDYMRVHHSALNDIHELVKDKGVK